MVNKVFLIGNLGADPEIKVLDSGTKLARISLATNESYRDNNGELQSKTQWHNVIAWRWNADRAEGLKKGNRIYIEGKIEYRKYSDDQGIEKYITDIVADRLYSMERREGDYSNPRASFEGLSEPPLRTTTDSQPVQGEQPTVNNSAESEDDLPF